MRRAAATVTIGEALSSSPAVRDEMPVVSRTRVGALAARADAHICLIAGR
jgi:hypothetical protein